MWKGCLKIFNMRNPIVSYSASLQHMPPRKTSKNLMMGLQSQEQPKSFSILFAKPCQFFSKIGKLSCKHWTSLRPPILMSDAEKLESKQSNASSLPPPGRRPSDFSNHESRDSNPNRAERHFWDHQPTRFTHPGGYVRGQADSLRLDGWSPGSRIEIAAF